MIKAQEDDKYRVDALMRLTRKLYMGLEPTVENLTAISDDVGSAISYWMFGGVEKDDSPIIGPQRNPYFEEVEWLTPFRAFLASFMSKRYSVKGKSFRVINRKLHNLYCSLYGFGVNHKYLCASEWCHCFKDGFWWLRADDDGRSRLNLDMFIMAVDDFEDLAETNADEGSYLSQKWRELEEELRRIGGLPTPANAEPLPEEESAEDAKWREFLAEMSENARNPRIRADICVRWQEVKKDLPKREPNGMKDAVFQDVVDWVNEQRNPGDPVAWTREAAEKWARRHKGLIDSFLREMK